MSGKKFKFPLENVLKLRRHETEQARQALGQAAEDVRRQEEKQAAARQRLNDLARQIPVGGAVDPFALRQYDAFRRDAQRAFEEAGRVLERLRQKEAKARELLMQKRRDEEALQTLYDQQKAEHGRLQETAEMEFLDEQAISGFNRKRQSY